jgi:hypothetical protein
MKLETRTTAGKMALVKMVLGGVLLGLSFATTARAGADLTWSGVYRIEGVQIVDPEMSGNREKSYLLHGLKLTPTIVAADGFRLHTQIDILANQLIAVGPGETPTKNANDSNTLARQQRPSTVQVSQAYVSWTHEFGQLVAGIAPLHFGLGTAVNGGLKPLDKQADTRGLVAYRFSLGDFSLTPIYGKVHEGRIGSEDDVSDYIFHFQYENPDTDLAIGLWYQVRVTTKYGNDTPASISGSAATAGEGYKTSLLGIYNFQKLGDFTVGFEADILDGTTGMKLGDGREVGVKSYSMVLEAGYQPADSKWNFKANLGMVSGDNPSTPETLEGFQLHPNYDIGFLMYNHPLGQGDFFRTAAAREVGNQDGVRPSDQRDTEVVSNTVFIAPSWTHRWAERFSWGGRLVYGILDRDPINGSGTAKNLGFEANLNLTYKPFERFFVTGEVGALLPGDAWKGGSSNFESKMVYGWTARAAVTF